MSIFTLILYVIPNFICTEKLSLTIIIIKNLLQFIADGFVYFSQALIAEYYLGKTVKRGKIIKRQLLIN